MYLINFSSSISLHSRQAPPLWESLKFFWKKSVSSRNSGIVAIEYLVFADRVLDPNANLIEAFYLALTFFDGLTHFCKCCKVLTVIWCPRARLVFPGDWSAERIVIYYFFSMVLFGFKTYVMKQLIYCSAVYPGSEFLMVYQEAIDLTTDFRMVGEKVSRASISSILGN
jgi:hypothetical protein